MTLTEFAWHAGASAAGVFSVIMLLVVAKFLNEFL